MAWVSNHIHIFVRLQLVIHALYSAVTHRLGKRGPWKIWPWGEGSKCQSPWKRHRWKASEILTISSWWQTASKIEGASTSWKHHAHLPPKLNQFNSSHYDDVIMDAIASQITSLTIVYSNVYSGADQSKHQSSASLAFLWGIHRGPVNSPHKWPVTRKIFPFDDVIMENEALHFAPRQYFIIFSIQ